MDHTFWGIRQHMEHWRGSYLAGSTLCAHKIQMNCQPAKTDEVYHLVLTTR